jgi:hypothetical protein
MARSKSTSGGKTNINKEQTSISSPASVPDVQAVAAGTASAEIKAEPRMKTETIKTETMKTETQIKPEPKKKLEVVKTEPRRVVPINLEDEIRRRAYELYQQRGGAPGSEAEDWLAAEREVRQRYHQQQTA